MMAERQRRHVLTSGGKLRPAKAAHHRLGPDLLMRKGELTGCALWRVECSCGWSTPWLASLVGIVHAVHGHRVGVVIRRAESGCGR